jgi:geranylgeranyl pyrophosphate synthase
MELYWQMVEGKTSSLLAACLTMGALLAGANGTQQNKMMEFGHKIGAAFQVQDDWLGIWGDCESTGKSITSDLVAKKKTYPILLGILEKGQFLKLWQSLKKVTPENACQLADLLEKEGHRESTKKKFEELYSDGFGILDSLALDVDKSAPLKYAIQGLFGRIK